ncbi:four helix bundle protein [Neolewinella sp.]|uniref:four helix bundle protein n=1 Tax=Neolewinella sp. TaxID=2993543 RepID=UPI003B524381
MASHFRTLAAYRKGFVLATQLHKATLQFPRNEWGFIDQIRRSSRSVCANLAEVYGVRQYERHYQSKLTIAISENYETQVWLDFALHAKYIKREDYVAWIAQSEEVGRLLTYMLNNYHRYKNWNAPPKNSR